MKRLRLLALAALLPFGCDDSTSSPTAPVAAPPPFDAGPTQTPEAGTPDSGAAIDCPKPTSGPTQHGGSITTETWTAAGSPHVLAFDTTINGTVTIEPCAEVLIAEAKTIGVGATGKVVAEGAANKPIHIGASDPSKPFAQIRVGGGGTLRFAYVTIDGGGDPLNSVHDITGTILAQGSDPNAPTQETVFVDHVTIAGSKSNGLDLIDGAGFASGSQELTVTGAAQYPVSIWARALGTVPSGKYTGNATDEILLPGSGGASAINEDATMHDRGVPYRVGNSLTAGDLVVERQAPSTPGLATLTIEAGVKVRVKKGGVVEVQRFTGTSAAQGALVVKGTAAKPVVFTSAEATPAPGDWLGIWFGEIPAPNDAIDYAVVEYAGGTSGSGSDACNTPGSNDAAIRLFGLPSGAFVTNTTISNSGGHGIDRGWRNDTKIDFLPTNTFTNIAKCKESYPKDTNGSCPATVPCP